MQRGLAPWTSGLLQVAGPCFGLEATLGWATLTRDALGQPIAAFTLWLPEGFGSSHSCWATTVFALANLVDRRVELLIDSREDTGEIQRQAATALPALEYDGPLGVPGEYTDEEVFTALALAARHHLVITAVTEVVLAGHLAQPESAALADTVREMRWWSPARR